MKGGQDERRQRLKKNMKWEEDERRLR